jgi:hypothetical protein
LESLKGREHLNDHDVDGAGNIDMDLKKIALLGVDWIRVARNNGQWLSF